LKAASKLYNINIVEYSYHHQVKDYKVEYISNIENEDKTEPNTKTLYVL